MKRYMKNNKFDFFQSPHPRTKDYKDNIHSDSENNDLHLFQTPVRLNSFSPFSPNINIDYCSNQKTANKRPYYDDMFIENIQNSESLESYQQSIKQINEKLQYSQQLLINLTPSKNIIIDDEYFSTTVKKQSYQFSSPNQVKFYERGLKKLAFEAFNFVSHQKKTTYKQVAKKLINQINDQNQLQIQRKGQMNIKRRVYDALNVLIALGLLKRNGNKIIGKKLNNECFLLQADLQKQKLKKKQQSLFEELEYVNGQFNKRTQLLTKKKKIADQLKQKLSTLRVITQRNRNQMVNQSQYLHKGNNRISLPFVCVFMPQKPVKQQLIEIQLEKTHNKLIILQQNKYKLFCKSSSSERPTCIGDTDLLLHLPIQHITYISQGKTQRNKKIKHR